MEGEISVRGDSRTASPPVWGPGRGRRATATSGTIRRGFGAFVDDADFGPHFQAGVVGGWEAVIQGTADFPRQSIVKVWPDVGGFQVGVHPRKGGRHGLLRVLDGHVIVPTATLQRQAESTPIGEIHEGNGAIPNTALPIFATPVSVCVRGTAWQYGVVAWCTLRRGCRAQVQQYAQGTGVLSQGVAKSSRTELVPSVVFCQKEPWITPILSAPIQYAANGCDPYRGRDGRGRCNRGYRCAPPPANGCDAYRGRCLVLRSSRSALWSGRFRPGPCRRPRTARPR